MMENKSSESATNTRGAQPVGRNLTDCISWRIQVHVTELAEERQGKRDLLLLQRPNQTLWTLPK